MVAIIISSFLFKKLHYNNAPRLLSPSPPWPQQLRWWIVILW
jgi:hypothetical protein